jgi:DNA-binding helix-hairpin-helix protein with protein kinase domain
MSMKKAFYIENDIYVNPIETENIDYVYSPRYGYLKLNKNRKVRGGEGVLYGTYNNLFLKIYHPNHLTYTNLKKLQTMLSIDVRNPFILWPKDLIFYENDFAGYVMEELKEAKSIDELRDENFSSFKTLDRFVIVKNFLKNINYLHKKNILVGDMKLDNILVKQNKDVYIIDTGSFQIEDYACDVYHREYTERKMTEEELKQSLRALEDEYFPINKIIFEILMLKTPYYSKNNIEIDSEGSRNFEYPIAKDKLEPNPPYHIKIWLSLSENMRRFFYDYYKEGKITKLDDWITELESFIASKE